MLSLSKEGRPLQVEAGVKHGEGGEAEERATGAGKAEENRAGMVNAGAETDVLGANGVTDAETEARALSASVSASVAAGVLQKASSRGPQTLRPDHAGSA